ncbi:MAG: mechanosensitive ion channel domain-containing protein [Pseudohongiellaceae bacterium]
MNPSITTSLIGDFPEAAAVLVLVIGFFVAKFAQRQAGRLLAVLDRLVSRYSTNETSIVSPDIARIGQSAAYWFIVLLTVLIALRILGAGQLSAWLDDTLQFVPRIIVGIVIIGIGHILGVIARFVLSHLSDKLDPESPSLRIIHGLIVIIAIVLGLQQMLIDITFITQLLLIVLFVVSGGLSLSFALGAKYYVANVIAQSETDRINIGDRIRVDDVEGEVVEKTATSVRVDSKDGVVSIPCLRFIQTTVTQLHEAGHDK